MYRCTLYIALYSIVFILVEYSLARHFTQSFVSVSKLTFAEHFGLVWFGLIRSNNSNVSMHVSNAEYIPNMRYPIIPSYMKCNDFKQEPTKCLDIRQTSNCWYRIHICMFMLAHNQIQSQNCIRFSGSICVHAWIFLLYIIIWFLFCFVSV